MGLLSEIPKIKVRNLFWPKTEPGKEIPLNMNRLKQILEEIDLEKVYKLLTKRERKIISLYYLEGYKDIRMKR